MAKLVGRQPNLAQLLVLKHAIAGLLFGRALDSDTRVGGDEELLAPRPVEQLVENSVQSVCQDRRACADPVESGNDVGIGDIGEATAPPAVGERDAAAPTLIPATVLHHP